uniref:Uncharacterized protein n=1 Tax=Caenorhabditis japonica TaxID=281687 RepID=A0A8R1DSE0_CAEJA
MKCVEQDVKINNFVSTKKNRLSQSEPLPPERLTLTTSSTTEDEPEQVRNITDVPEKFEDEDNRQKSGNDELTDSKKEKEEKKDEKKDDVQLNMDNLHFRKVVEFQKGQDLNQFVLHAKTVFEQTAAFQWTMKKKISFDEGCWKHLNRRVSALQREGFEVRVNTQKARDNKRTQCGKTYMDEVFAGLMKQKPKKKGQHD